MNDHVTIDTIGSDLINCNIIKLAEEFFGCEYYHPDIDNWNRDAYPYLMKYHGTITGTTNKTESLVKIDDIRPYVKVKKGSNYKFEFKEELL